MTRTSRPFNEGARPILQAVANGIEEAAGSVSKLKALVTDGKISNTAFFRGFQAGVQELRDKAATAEPPISHAMIMMRNAIMRMVGEVDKSSGFSKGIVGELSSMAEGFDKATGPIKEVVGLLQKLADLQKYISDNGLNLGKKLNQAIFGSDTVEKYLFPPKPVTPSGGGIGSDPDRNYRPPEKPKPIKAADYPVVGGKDKSESLDEYERATRTLQENTRMLEAETAAVGKSVFEKQRALDVQKLLNAAMEAGKAISPQLRAEIEREAEAHARATQTLTDAEHKQEQIRSLQNEVGQTLTSSISGMVTGARTLNDTLADVLDKLIEMALQAALLGSGPLAGLMGGGSGIIGSMFGGFRAEGGPVQANRAYVVGERGPEVIVPGRAGSVIPNSAIRPASLALPSLPKMGVGGAGVAPTFNFAPTVNVSGGGGSLSENRDLSHQMVNQLRDLLREEMFEFVRVQQGPHGILER